MSHPHLSAIKAELDRLTAEFFRAVSFEAGEVPSYELLHTLLISSGLLIKNTAATPEIASVEQFIELRLAMVRAGQLTRSRNRSCQQPLTSSAMSPTASAPTRSPAY